MEKDPKKRVVVTGLGVSSSLGFDIDEWWTNICDGKSGISEIEYVDNTLYDNKFAGEIKSSMSLSQKFGRAVNLLIRASRNAILDSKLDIRKISYLEKTGISVGTTTGNIGVLEKIQYLNRKILLNQKKDLFDFPASNLSKIIGDQNVCLGTNSVFSTACSAANYSLINTFNSIRKGKLIQGFVGGSDGISRIVFTGFNRLFAVASKKCAPFSLNRKGMIPAEGAAVLLLESLDSALARGAEIYAEVAGYGLSCDAHHMTQPNAVGVAKAMRKALKNSGINPEEVDYISAHGTGTRENDRAESQAILDVFGDDYGRKVPVSSIKSMLGHTMGAAAAFESIACCLAIKHSRIPPTINFSEPDPECPINCVPNQSIEREVNVAMNNAQAFGGNNACVMLRKI